MVSETVERYRSAAEQGDVEALRKLGDICRRARKYPEAAKWFQRAAELGDEIAQRRLAAMYRRGEGMTRDHGEAAKWVYRADKKRGESSQGHVSPGTHGGASQRPRTVRFWRSGEELGTLPRAERLRRSSIATHRPRTHAYTEDEIILCTYIARFGRRFIDEGQICSLSHIRSVASIKAKVSNIAHMMLEEGYGCSRKVSPLSGKPTGEQGRRTNWEVVRTLVDLTEPEFKRQITEILSCHA